MKIQALLRRFAAAPAVCSLLLVAPFSHATTFTLDTFGFINGSESFFLTTTQSPLVENPVPAGGFSGTATFPPSAPVNITFWCAQLTQDFSPPHSYQYSAVAIPSSAGVDINLHRLFAEVGASSRVDTTIDSAAFQLAIWEILFEGTTTSPYSVSTGDFKAVGDPVSADATASINQANSWLAGLGTGTPTNALFFLTNPDRQDFITDIPIPTLFQTPEPASLALLGIGMLAAIATRRRTPKVGRQ